MRTWIVGIDLAWGERRPDGVCVFEVADDRTAVHSVQLAHGDNELLAIIDALPAGESGRANLLVRIRGLLNAAKYVRGLIRDLNTE